ncbi:MAG TPA: hypothetical protein PKC20_13815, partial [Burkholderiaceae bacterium]|nr:hypothetical protein [Burkholderiaceae bacterium]
LQYPGDSPVRADVRAMIALNARAELEGVAFETVARDWVASREAPRATSGGAPAAPRPGVVDRLFAGDLARLAAQHLALVAASTALAAALGVPLGVA